MGKLSYFIKQKTDLITIIYPNMNKKTYPIVNGSFIGLSEELSKLRKFKSYMNRSSVMAESLAKIFAAVCWPKSAPSSKFAGTALRDRVIYKPKRWFKNFRG